MKIFSAEYIQLKYPKIELDRYQNMLKLVKDLKPMVMTPCVGKVKVKVKTDISDREPFYLEVGTFDKDHNLHGPGLRISQEGELTESNFVTG